MPRGDIGDFNSDQNPESALVAPVSEGLDPVVERGAPLLVHEPKQPNETKAERKARMQRNRRLAKKMAKLTEEKVATPPESTQEEVLLPEAPLELPPEVESVPKETTDEDRARADRVIAGIAKRGKQVEEEVKELQKKEAFEREAAFEQAVKDLNYVPEKDQEYLSGLLHKEGESGRQEYITHILGVLNVSSDVAGLLYDRQKPKEVVVEEVKAPEAETSEKELIVKEEAPLVRKERLPVPEAFNTEEGRDHSDLLRVLGSLEKQWENYLQVNADEAVSPAWMRSNREFAEIQQKLAVIKEDKAIYARAIETGALDKEVEMNRKIFELIDDEIDRRLRARGLRGVATSIATRFNKLPWIKKVRHGVEALGTTLLPAGAGTTEPLRERLAKRWRQFTGEVFVPLYEYPEDVQLVKTPSLIYDSAAGVFVEESQQLPVVVESTARLLTGVVEADSSAEETGILRAVKDATDRGVRFERTISGGTSYWEEVWRTFEPLMRGREHYERAFIVAYMTQYIESLDPALRKELLGATSEVTDIDEIFASGTTVNMQSLYRSKVFDEAEIACDQLGDDDRVILKERYASKKVINEAASSLDAANRYLEGLPTKRVDTLQAESAVATVPSGAGAVLINTA